MSNFSDAFATSISVFGLLVGTFQLADVEGLLFWLGCTAASITFFVFMFYALERDRRSAN
jgi:arginine exporter protein ArgO